MVQFCDECNLVIASKDPNAKFHNGVKFHGDCLPKYQLRLDAQFRARQQLKRREPWNGMDDATGVSER